MRLPVSWLRDHAELPVDLSAEDLARRLTALGLKLESLERPGSEMRGPLVVGRVLDFTSETHSNGKTVRWCSLDVGDANGTGEPQGVLCGAHNFAVGDLVVVVLPGGAVAGGYEIDAAPAYGHISAGMICSERELGIGEDQSGILVLPKDAGAPGDDAFAVLPLREEVIELEINPDRAYALSVRGVARDAALGFGVPFHDPALDAALNAAGDVPQPNGTGYPVVVEDPAGCPAFAATMVTGFDPTAATPRWMARRIQLAGMRPISLAVDVTNYVMLLLGQPIHGFDRDLLSGPIRVRRAREGERVTTLDGVERAVHPEDLLITDDTGPIGLAGVMGGETTELGPTTTSIVVEAAHWDPATIFRTERRHKLPSEAAKRFERGVDPTLPVAAASLVARLLVEHGGGVVEDGVTLVGGAPASRSVTLPVDLPARVTGIDIPASVVTENLAAVGCEVAESGGRVSAVVPPWRPDLTDPFDLVEEVARVVGYDRVPSVLPTAPAGRGLTRDQRLRRRIGRTLAGGGFVEVMSFPFVGSADLDALGVPADDDRRSVLRLANPLSSEEPAMTSTLLPGILKATARNAGLGTTDLALFETATVTLPRGSDSAASRAPILPVDRRPTDGELAALDKALPEQPLHLALTVTGDRERAGWWGPARPAGWADVIDAVRRVASAVGVEIAVRSAARAPWHPGRCAELWVSEAMLGHAGELHPRVCRAYGVPERTAAAEIDLDLLIRHAVDVTPAPSFSSYPVAKEDVALVVAADTPAAEVEDALREGAGPLLESVWLFDVYTGDQVGPDRKSLAFALRFRAPDRTLVEGEAGAARDAAVALAAERCGAVQRT